LFEEYSKSLPKKEKSIGYSIDDGHQGIKEKVELQGQNSWGVELLWLLLLLRDVCVCVTERLERQEGR
jgi:hypothetical protein